MNCLKCGAETQDRQVFCQHCQQVMLQYPVRPDAPVFLPTPRANTPKRPTLRQEKPEEQLARMRKKVHRLGILAAVLFLALSVSLFGLYFVLSRPSSTGGPAIGQNYSSSATITPRVLNENP